MNHNQEAMTREVYCPKCNTYEDRSEAVPICHICKSKLQTVVLSQISGERLTRRTN